MFIDNQIEKRISITDMDWTRVGYIAKMGCRLTDWTHVGYILEIGCRLSDWTHVGYIVEIGCRLLTELISIGTFAFYRTLKGHLWWE